MKGADRPRFLQGVFKFEGQGMDAPQPLDPPLTYTVPAGVTTRAAYVRAGNTSDALICVVLAHDGQTMGLFPVGAKDAVHVPIRIAERVPAASVIEVLVAGQAGMGGRVVVDVGLVEG